MLELLLLLLGIAFATVGLSGYAIFGPLTCRHLQDRGRADEMGGSSLTPRAVRWLLVGGYRCHEDPLLRQLALPARIMLWLTLTGVTLILLRLAIARFT